jgi:hypothetical protein
MEVHKSAYILHRLYVTVQIKDLWRRTQKQGRQMQRDGIPVGAVTFGSPYDRDVITLILLLIKRMCVKFWFRVYTW